MSDPGPRSWRPPWSAVVLVLGLAGLLGALYVFRSARQLPLEVAQQGRQALEDVRRIAEAFRTGKVTYAFASEATQLNGSTRLQLATLRQVEVFQRKDEAAVFWGNLQLPDVVVEARAPVEYVYYADLQKAWTFRLERGEVLVTAPPLEFNTPAIDASALAYAVREGSLLRDEALAQERLRLGLTELARRRARQNVALVRDTARQEVQRFVETWLVRSFTDAKDYRVRVVFADEPARLHAPALPRLEAVPSPRASGD